MVVIVNPSRPGCHALIVAPAAWQLGVRRFLQSRRYCRMNAKIEYVYDV
jgi:hypothetical protein